GLLKGTVPPGVALNLSKHLRTCVACQKTVQDLTQGTTSWVEVADRWRQEAAQASSGKKETQIAQQTQEISAAAKDGEGSTNNGTFDGNVARHPTRGIWICASLLVAACVSVYAYDRFGGSGPKSDKKGSENTGGGEVKNP